MAKLGKALVLMSALLSSTLAWQDACSAWSSPNPQNVTLVKATYYAPGSLLLITTDTESGSFANTEVWLPDKWNERYMGLGNGGLSGGIVYADLAGSGLSRGFAAMSTNTGHNSTSTDGSWTVNADAVIDFGYRAVHLSTIAAKEAIRAYYGRPAKTNIWSSCSTGGRQGLKEAQMFADDYDGIVVGSPASWRRRLPFGNRGFSNIFAPNTSTRWIEPKLFTSVLHPAVIAQCDDIDGVHDDVIADPSKCRFDFAKLQCKAKQTSGCFSSDQIEALKRAYQDQYIGDFFLYPGQLFGSEASWATLINPNPAGSGMFAPANFTLADVQAATDPGMSDAYNPDIRQFTNKGGKLLHYVGLADGFVLAKNSINYYESVKTFYESSEPSVTLDDSYRLFEIPGMGHCQGGEGAWAMGGSGQVQPLKRDAKHDIVYAMLDWLDKGIAPEKLISTKWNGDDPELGVNFTRPICVLPKKQCYVGGDVESASSFECH